MAFSAGSSLSTLLAQFPRAGRVSWIGLRPARDVPMQEVDAAEALTGVGLRGDRYAGGSGKRGITILQSEHLSVIAALAGRATIQPSLLRRNLVVSGLPVIALKGVRFRIGEALFEGTGPCEPCSRMEDALGVGGYNAMRSHGGLTARILEGGWIRLGDALTVVAAEAVAA